MNKKIIFIFLITPRIFCIETGAAHSTEQSIHEAQLNLLKRQVSTLMKRQLRSPLHQSLKRLNGLLHEPQLNEKNLGTEAVTFLSLLQSPIQHPKGHSLTKTATGTAAAGSLAAIMALINDQQKITRSVDNSSNSLAIVALITSIIALVLQAATFIHDKFFNRDKIIADNLNRRINNISRLVEAQENKIGAVSVEQANQAIRIGEIAQSVSETFASLSGYELIGSGDADSSGR